MNMPRIDKPQANRINSLPILLLPIETLSFSLAGHITWLIGAPIIIYNLGFASMYIWVIGSIIALLNLVVVRNQASKYLEISGGISSYITRLYPQNSFFAKYGSLAYYTGWVSIPAAATSLLSIFISHIFVLSSDPIVVKLVQIFFIVLISSIGFSSNKLISVFHTILTIPAVVATVLITLGSASYILVKNHQIFITSFSQIGTISIVDFFKFFFIAIIILFTSDTAISFIAESENPLETIKSTKWSMLFLPFVYILVSFILLILLGSQKQMDLFNITYVIANDNFGPVGLFFTTIWIISGLFVVCTTVIAHAPRILHQLSLDGKIGNMFAVTSKAGSLQNSTLFTILFSTSLLFLDNVYSILVVASTPYLISYILFHSGVLFNKQRKPLLVAISCSILVPFEIACFLIGGISLNWQLVSLGILLPLVIIFIDKLLSFLGSTFKVRLTLLTNKFTIFKSIDHTVIIFTQILMLLAIEIITILSTWFMLLYMKNESFLYRLDHLALILVVSCFSSIALAALTIFSQIQNLDEKSKELTQLNLKLKNDIELRSVAEQALITASFRDSLTSLGNRKLLRKNLQTYISKTKKTSPPQLGIIILNINRFKSINNSLGNIIGDELLIVLSNHLVTILPENFSVYRFGSDEFVIIAPDVIKITEMETIAQDILSSLGAPFRVKNKHLYITASLGVNMINDFDYSVDSILSETNVALLEAKKNGKNNYSLFDKKRYDRVLSLLTLETKLPEAIRNKEFELFYQPIINLKSNKIAGYETLIRWCHDGSLLFPSSFIHMAEETDLILPLTWQILEKACFDIRSLQKKFNNDYLRINVNFSLKQFFEPNLVKRIVEIAQKAEVAVSCIKIEITESMLQDSEDLKYVMNEMLENDIKLNLDDFGTGYSSLGYLNTLPISALKIDKSFIRSLNPKSLEITKAMINLASNIGAWTIVEGIETQEQLTKVKEMGANFGQGYYFARPMPFEEIIEFSYPPISNKDQENGANSDQ